MARSGNRWWGPRSLKRLVQFLLLLFVFNTFVLPQLAGTRDAIELLTASLEGATAAVRLAIATVIGRIGRHQDAEVIELLLKDPSAPVRRAAVEALAHLEPGTAAESLRLALADEAAAVRIAAAGALGAAENLEVIDVLRCLADDEEPDVRAAAVRAVGCRYAASPDESHRSLVMRLVDAALADEPVVALAACSSQPDDKGPNDKKSGDTRTNCSRATRRST